MPRHDLSLAAGCSADSSAPRNATHRDVVPGGLKDSSEAETMEKTMGNHPSISGVRYIFPSDSNKTWVFTTGLGTHLETSICTGFFSYPEWILAYGGQMGHFHVV